MGYATAEAFAETVDLHTAISWHLQYNHYPPVPTTMVDPCIAAIEALEDDDVDREIDLPDGVTYRDRPTAPAWAIAEQHHLHAFNIHDEG